ncbi:MAG: amidase, partial [Deltaproteobacteria bacterium]|nr:amidase [Deltaproteobacteria bacterium]
MLLPEYDQMDAIGLAKLVAKGDISAAEVLDAAIERIETRNPALNAVNYKAYDAAREAIANGLPDGPFKGVPFLLKDLGFAWAGHPLTGGSRFTRNYVPNYTSHLVQRFIDSGLVILGKTNVPEYGLMGITEPKLFGPTRNPWNLDHTPGGSSGGASSAVAARMVPMAHAGDGGGSIRIPSSHCNLFGMKPSRGRISFAPDCGESWSSFVSPHVLTHSVRDSAAMLDAISGMVPGDPYTAPVQTKPFLKAVAARPKKLRIAYWARPLFGSSSHPDCEMALGQAVAHLKDLGHTVETACPTYDRETLIRSYWTIITTSLAHAMESTVAVMGRQPTEEEIETPSWFLGEIGKKTPALELVRARSAIHQASRDVAAFFSDYDVFLTPTVAKPAVRVGELGLKKWEEIGSRLLRRVGTKGILDAVLGEIARDA